MKPAIAYSPDVEVVESDEAETARQLNESFGRIIETTHKDYGHAFRGVHAKSHALLDGRFEVLANLPEELAQGLFAEPASCRALMRISATAGDPLPDQVSLPRGFAVKVIGVPGERLPESLEMSTQDFVLATGAAFSAPSPKSFARTLKALAATTDRAEGAKKVLSSVLRPAEAALEAVGLESATLKALGGYPLTHPLGEAYFSQVPIRFGRHMGKIAVVPVSDSFTALKGKKIALSGRTDALRQEIGAVLAKEGGAWEIRVQLCRDLAANPIENASVAWPEEDNPYLPIGRITVAAQPSWSEERADLLDDQTSFSPWHALAAHRPLGGIMRARRPVYAFSSGLRAKLNGCPLHEPAADVAMPG